MAVDVIMPKMGESITEGTVLEWKKNIGESIEKDETLLEISTDKVDSEVPAPASGTVLEIIAKVNDTIPVGEVIARIGAEGDVLQSPPEPPKPVINKDTSPVPETVSMGKQKVSKSTITPVREKASKRFYSPLVKSIAKVEGISMDELETISGSGKNGRVNKSDILNYVENRTSAVPSIDRPVTSEPETPPVPPVTETVAVKPTPVATPPMGDRVEPMSRMRKRIADHMVASVQTSPHVYTTVEADVTNLVDIRSELKESFKNSSGVNLTYTPMILDACIKTIKEFPLMNASLEGDNIIHHGNINMGVAVALPNDNLIVPVIHSAEERNFLGLARSTADLAGRARDNKLTPDEIFGSTFTVTNPGVFGSLFGMGIINQPNVGILSVGAFKKRPVVKETEYGDTIVIRSMVYLTLSYDHRIIDGAYGTKFLARLVENIESYSKTRIQN